MLLEGSPPAAARRVPSRAATPATVVAIPARDEAARIGACLRALAGQADAAGRPLPPGAFGVLVLVNNTADGTAGLARALAPALPFPLRVVEVALPPGRAHVGWARRLALDAAAAWLTEAGAGGAPPLLLGTDADGRAAPGWVAAMRAAVAGGAEAVAGTFAVDPAGAARLPPAVRARMALEDAYAARLDRLASLIDPDPADPWPRHDVHSGASFGLTLAAYRRLGGLRPVHICEDRWLFRDLAAQDARIRHALDAVVEVSCRLEGRAAGGWADTTRSRVERADAGPVDERLESCAAALRRLEARAAARAQWRAADRAGTGRLAARLRLDAAAVAAALAAPHFGAAWATLEAAGPTLRLRTLAPAALPAEMRAAGRAVARLLAAQPARRSTSRR